MFIPCAIRSSFTLSIHFFGCLPLILVPSTCPYSATTGRRQHPTKFAGQLSGVASTCASMVQCSGVGPSEYDVYLSDYILGTQLTPSWSLQTTRTSDRWIHPHGGYNNPRCLMHTVQEELLGVQHWAETNNLRLNTRKSKEMIVVGSERLNEPLSPLVGMERVDALKIPD